MANKVILAIALVCSAMATYAQERPKPEWSVGFGSVFDNREGDDGMYDDKTFFFTTLSVEGGLRFTKHDKIAAGAEWTQPLENGVKDGTVRPTLYYRHDGRDWKFSMGMFPRTQLREPLPGFMWCDSLAYFQRNIRGALVQYGHENGFFDAYIDWRAHQTETRREAFNIVFNGQWRPAGRRFLVGARLLMNHFAKTRNAGPEESIVDNFMVNPFAGYDFRRQTALDSLIVKAGLLQTIERYRGNDKGWVCPGRLWVEATAEWKMLGVKNSLFIGGENLLPLYSEFGTMLYQGESYYRSDFYNRTDLYVHIIRNRFMTLQGQLNFNFARSNFMFYQRLLLEVSLDSWNYKTGTKRGNGRSQAGKGRLN